MQAIDWFGSVASGSPISAGSEENGNISIEFSVDGDRYSYSIKKYNKYKILDGKVTENVDFHEILSSIDGDGRESVMLKRVGEVVWLAGSEDSLTISLSKSAINWLTSFLPRSDSRRAPLLRVWHYFTRVTYYPLSEVLSSEDVTFVVADELSKWADGVDSWKCISAVDTIRNIIKMNLGRESGSFDELKFLLGPDQLDVVDDIDVDVVPLRVNARDAGKEDNVAYVVAFKPSGHTGTFSFDRLSFGTKRVIQMITSVLSDHAHVSMLEQPEDGIHPALLYKIVPMIRSYVSNRQFIFSSHSPAVLNAVAPEEVRLIEMANGRTYARSLTDVEIGAAHNYLAREGPLSDFIGSL
ncbi:ATP-binding protein [Burkholderia glumae]|nr:ATP-binding protein [Burkholderia glumae]